MSFQHLPDSSSLIKPARHFLLNGQVYSIHACPSDYHYRKRPSIPDGDALPKLTISVKISQVIL